VPVGGRDADGDGGLRRLIWAEWSIWLVPLDHMRMSWHAFLDESRRGPTYLVAVVTIRPRDLDATRTAIRRFVKPGQRRVHFAKESPARRREVVARLADLGIRARIGAHNHPNDAAARRTCQVAATRDLLELGVTRLSWRAASTRTWWIGRPFEALPPERTSATSTSSRSRTRSSGPVTRSPGASGPAVTGVAGRKGCSTPSELSRTPEQRETRQPTVRTVNRVHFQALLGLARTTISGTAPVGQTA
jgi:hypothetical protein